MKILLFLPKAFEHMESSVFIDVFGWAKHEFSYNVQLVTGGFTREVVSTFGVPIVVDKLIDELSADEYDALALPGGFGEFGYLDEAYNEKLLDLIREFDRPKKIIAAVCMAGLVLGKSGILKGRRATTYYLRNSPRLDMLREFGAATVTERIVIDRNVITSCGPETAVWVSFKLLEMLTSPTDADKIKAAMGYLFTIDNNGMIV